MRQGFMACALGFRVWALWGEGLGFRGLGVWVALVWKFQLRGFGSQVIADFKTSVSTTGECLRTRAQARGIEASRFRVNLVV